MNFGNFKEDTSILIISYKFCFKYDQIWLVFIVMVG